MLEQLDNRSMVDIFQTVGGVIRNAAGEPLGTIVIPDFINESEDADHVLSQSAFEPVWQVFKALRAHDRRLADELDQLCCCDFTRQLLSPALPRKCSARRMHSLGAM